MLWVLRNSALIRATRFFKRLGQIIVRSVFKSLYFILKLVSGRQHDNRNMAERTDLPTQLPSVHVRHHPIHNQQVVRMLMNQSERMIAVERLRHLKTVVEKVEFQ